MKVDYQNSYSISRALEDAQELLSKLSNSANEPAGLTPKQWRLISEMNTSIMSLRATHVKDATINNRKTSIELTTMWNLPPDWVSQFKAIHVPHKRVLYLGAILRIYAGVNYIAYDKDGIAYGFGIEPKSIDGVWQSRGESNAIARMLNVPNEYWESSLRSVDELKVVQNATEN